MRDWPVVKELVGVEFPVSVHVWMVPLAGAKPGVRPDNAYTCSVALPVKVRFAIVGAVASTTSPVPEAAVAPVPPLATGKVPVTPVVRGSPVTFVSVPEVGVPRIGVTNVGLVDSTLLPEPVEVVTPVPPLRTGTTPTELIVDMMAKSKPFQATNEAVPLATDTPSVAAPLMTEGKPPVVRFTTTYVLLCEGAVIVRIVARAPVSNKTACRAWFVARVVADSVTSASVLRVVVPATASSSRDVMELLTVSPHVPDSSPDTGRAKPKSDVAAVVIGLPYVVGALYLRPSIKSSAEGSLQTVWLSSTGGSR